MKKNILPFAFLLTISLTGFSQVWSPKAAGTLPANYTVADISVVSDQVIWATVVDWTAPMPIPAAFVSKLLRSTDGGENWEVQDIEEATGRFCWDIHAFDENTACVTTQDFGGSVGRGIFRTTDGGVTWTEVFHNVAGGVWLHFFDNQEGICINADFMARTTNGGQTWALVPGGNIPNFSANEGTLIWSTSTSLEALGDVLWFGTTKGRIFKSTDRGQNWSAFNTGLGSNAEMNSVAFIDENNGLASYFLPGSGRRLARTTDGGESWQFVENTSLLELTAIPCTKTFLGVSYFDNLTRYSTDLGQTWAQVDDQVNAYAPVFNSPGLGWAATGEDTGTALYKWIGGELYGRTYVNQNASGNNDGSTWADAYTNLQAALAAAEEDDEIWVVEGTYLPAAPGGSQTATFLIDKNLKLYGGFTGAECNLSERDIELHPTVLSGDLNGNDIAGNPTANKSDNVLHVVQVNANVTNATLIDGFSIRNGQADGIQLDDQRGGGLYAFGSLTIQNCSFTENLAQLNGGGMIARNLSSTVGTSIEMSNCVFDNNRTGSDGGGLSLLVLGPDANFTVTGCQFMENESPSEGGGFAVQVGPNAQNATFTVADCQFNHNEANVGGGMYINSSRNFTVSGCTFSDNAAVAGTTQAAGGGLNINQSSGSVTNCTFNGNQSALYGGGLLAIDYLGSPGNSNVEVLDCHFEGNSSGGSDGGLSFNSWVSNNKYVARRCDFKNNTAVDFGGGLSFYAQQPSNNTQMLFDSCTFSQNHCGGNGGGAWMIGAGKTMKFDFNRCQFTQNTSGSEGGAANFWATNGGMGTLTVDSCLFENNSSVWTGGIEMGSGWDLAAQFDFVLTNSTLKNNHATELAGGMVLWSDEKAKTNFWVDNCLVDGNTSAGEGGGIYFIPASTDFHATVRNTRITSNQSAGEGGALYSSSFFENVPFPTNASIVFENCLLAGNTSTDATIAADSLPNLQFLNCTIAGNSGGGIQLSDQSGLTLQNTILHNPGFTEYTAATTDVTFTSHGGNLVHDLSLDGKLIASDLQNADPLFAAPGDFHLTENSPAVNAGVNDGVTAALDLDGKQRIQGFIVDMGAYESEFLTSANEVEGETLLAVSPNPATDFLRIKLPENASGAFEVQVFDARGRLLRSQSLAVGQRLDLQGLAPGMYSLKVVAGERVFAGKFVKQ